jgi:hypothetical protein
VLSVAWLDRAIFPDGFCHRATSMNCAGRGPRASRQRRPPSGDGAPAQSAVHHGVGYATMPPPRPCHHCAKRSNDLICHRLPRQGGDGHLPYQRIALDSRCLAAFPGRRPMMRPTPGCACPITYGTREMRETASGFRRGRRVLVGTKCRPGRAERARKQRRRKPAHSAGVSRCRRFASAAVRATVTARAGGYVCKERDRSRSTTRGRCSQGGCIVAPPPKIWDSRDQ